MIVKKKIIICCIFMLSNLLNLYAAVVSDNDGAAFITKAEFDSLKNNFQTQIDQYNTRIDSKIDNAIASYLAGITISKSTTKGTICYDVNGILAPRANYADLAWAEGTMKMDIRIFYSCGGQDTDRCGSLISTWNGKTATEFNELAVKNVNYDTGTAEWVGFIKSLQEYYGSSFDVPIYSISDFPLDPIKYASLYNNCYAKSNIDFSTHGSSVTHFQYSPTTTSPSKGVFCSGNQSRFVRTINETSKTNIICVPQSVSCARFSNVDEIRDWCNDTNKQGHTLMTYLSEIFDTGETTRKFLATAGSRKVTVETFDVDFSTNPQCNYSSDDIRRAKPYFGFVRSATDYNKIWTSRYDSYTDDMLDLDDNSNVLYDSKNRKYHLNISAGAPIIKIKNDRLLTIDLDFEDKTKDYDVWFKYGTFNNVNPNSDTNLVSVDDIYYGTNKTTKATVGSQSKSIKVANGRQKVTLEAKKDAYIFIKWSLSGNSGAGGGVFLPPSTVIDTEQAN